MYQLLKMPFYKMKVVKVALLISLISFWLIRMHWPFNNSPCLDRPIHTVSFSTNDDYLAVASVRNGSDDRFHLSDGGIQIWEVASKKLHRTVRTFRHPYNPNASVSAFYSVDGEQLISKTPTDEVVVYDSTSFEHLQQKPKRYVSNRYVTWSQGSSAEIVDNKEQRSLYIRTPQYSKLIETPYAPSSICFDAVNQQLAVIDMSAKVFIFDLEARKIVAQIDCGIKSWENVGGYAAGSAIAWLPKHNLLWISNVNGRSMFWDVSQHKVISDVILPFTVSCMATSHTGDLVAFGTDDGCVKIVKSEDLHNAAMNGNIAHIVSER